MSTTSDESVSPEVPHRPPPFVHLDTNGRPWRPVPRWDFYGLLDRIAGSLLVKQALRNCYRRKEERIDDLERELLETSMRLSIATSNNVNLRIQLRDLKNKKKTRSGRSY